MIEPSPTAPLGSVVHLPSYDLSPFTPTSAILCRLTAPLITFAFDLIRKSVPCKVLGRDIGMGLIKLVEAQRADSLTELASRLIANRNREAGRAYAKGDDAGAAAIEDKYDALNIFVQSAMRNRGSIFTLKQSISDLFDPARTHILTLSTIHKAKGLEWPMVFFLDPHLIPSKWCKLPWQFQQERNLKYVGATRAKERLFYIKSSSWK